MEARVAIREQHDPTADSQHQETSGAQKPSGLPLGIPVPPIPEDPEHPAPARTRSRSRTRALLHSASMEVLAKAEKLSCFK